VIEQFLPYILVATVVFGGLCAVVTTRNITRISPIHNQIKEHADLYIKDLEKQNLKLYGRVAQAKKSNITITAEEANDPFSAIGSIIDQIAPQLPSSIRPLLKNKNAIGFIENFIKSNPDTIKSIMEKFTGQPGNNTKGAPAVEESTL